MIPLALSHLAPFSYIERFVLLSVSLVYLVLRLSQNKHGFAVLRPVNMNTRQPNIQGLIATLNLVALILFQVYDVINVKIKYTEGFLVTQYLAEKDVVQAIPLPAGKWSPNDQFALLPVCNELINVTFALKSSAHFLALAYWHVTVKKQLGVSFGRTWEFLAYEAYSVLSLALYPIAQAAAPTVGMSIIYPQLVYHAENLIVVILTISIVVRMRCLLQQLSLPPSMVRRMQFYITLNVMQAVFVALEFIGLGTINIDAMTTGAFTKNAFWTDIFTAIFNIGYALATIVITTMVFPIFLEETDAADNVRMLVKFIRTPEGRSKFKTFCEKVMASENINFVLQVAAFKDDYARRTHEDNLLLAQQIYNEYLAPGAPQEVNLSFDAVEGFRANGFKDDTLLFEDTFTYAQQEILKLLDSETFARFKVQNPAVWNQFAEKVDQERRLRGALLSNGVGDQSHFIPTSSVHIHVSGTSQTTSAARV
ncbi:RGS domain-containing protein [Plasmodiophora brassicae]